MLPVLDIHVVGRARRLSDASFSSSSEAESLASASPSPSTSYTNLLSTKSDELKRIFKAHKNLIVSPDRKSPVSPSIRLSFPILPSVTKEDNIWQHREAGSLLMEDELNPDAQTFVPQDDLKPGFKCSEQAPTPTQDDFRSIDIAWLQRLSPELEEQLRKYPTPPGLSLPVPIYNPAPLPLPKAQWFAAFAEGLNSQDPLTFERQAHLVASSCFWTDQDVEDLVVELVLRIYVNSEDSNDNVAFFAHCLFQAFVSVSGPIGGQAFLLQLRQHTLNIFVSSLDPASLIYTSRPENLYARVNGALSLALFIADLFEHGLLLQNHIMACLRRLFEGPVAVEEHVVAIGYLVTRAGSGLWEPSFPLEDNPIPSFLARFNDLAGRVQYSLLEWEASM
ncbi:hypothetical protein CC1G_03424 [Coprinopsis cinerea okayama7|uniref:Uncharacterized protein n=1 Tax=Coprinopsis cinerea (strain Okayama-7 / 130 / ATCC MYA-4618 / FGSC 9003) TaxID=240176 RepID=A8NQP1_COPC7|nr:hypothetical protein CC1G_03424 [Coprinopsis cinerea okayama7\|eukprot:XP_001835642.2 hypothetical protein CC1G_03424 [Coprinopsis cinerea okayama7\